MILQPVVEQIVQCINHSIYTQDNAHPPLTHAAMYRFLAVQFYYHQSRVSLTKGIDALRRMGRSTPTLADRGFILKFLISYDPTVHHDCDDEGGVWPRQRDATSQLEEFEVTSFSLVLRLPFFRLRIKR